MTRLESALSGGLNLASTQRLLTCRWATLCGDDPVLDTLVTYVREDRQQLRGALGRLLDRADPIVRKVMGIGIALAELAFFVEHERPMIREAFRLQRMKKDLLAMALAHLDAQPKDLHVGRRIMHLQEALHLEMMKLGASPTATYVALDRPGPIVAHLPRILIGALQRSGHSWLEIAELVDDGQVASGRPERYRKLHESDPLKGMRHLVPQA